MMVSRNDNNTGEIRSYATDSEALADIDFFSAEGHRVRAVGIDDGRYVIEALDLGIDSFDQIVPRIAYL